MSSVKTNQLGFQEYKFIPIQENISVNKLSPILIYKNIANNPYSYLLESANSNDQNDKYSIIGLSCKEHIRISNFNIQRFINNKCVESFRHQDPLQWLAKFHQQFKIPNKYSSLPMSGGLVGYFSYETIHYIEPKLNYVEKNNDLVNMPDILLMVSNKLCIINHEKKEATILIYTRADKKDEQDKAKEQINIIKKQILVLANDHEQEVRNTGYADLTLVEKCANKEFKEQDFKQAIEKIKQFIVDGRVMQVVLSQRLNLTFEPSPLSFYYCLRSLNPSPYLYYINLDNTFIVGSSPEILVKLKDNSVTVRPLAGTRPRGRNLPEDLSFAQDLLSDEKELAEHLMLIDLGRNDVSKVSEPNTVKVTDKMRIERYSQVMHIVSNVTGKLNRKYNALDVLKATFPAGTVSGAPKISAMQIINQLEPTKRGIYSGAIGYWGWNNNMDVAIAIRTAVIKNKKIFIQAGAGIVYDSDSEKEWQETINKAKALLIAVAMSKSLN